MSSPTNVLPTQDQYTTYDYNIGAARMSAVDSKQVQIEYLDETIQALAFHGILNNPFNEELRVAVFSSQCQMSSQVLGPKLKVTYHKNDGDMINKVNALTKEKTVEFAKKALVSWGPEAEKVLSATDTGSLYWNVIHHFGSFNALLLNAV